jgi:hypothetical protein
MRGVAGEQHAAFAVTARLLLLDDEARGPDGVVWTEIAAEDIDQGTADLRHRDRVVAPGDRPVEMMPRR